MTTLLEPIDVAAAAAIHGPELYLPDFFDDELPPRRAGKLREIGIAAGRPIYDLDAQGEFSENGERYYIGRVKGTSMEAMVPNASQVLLKILDTPIEIEPDGTTPQTGLFQDGHVYMADIDRAELSGVTLKRVWVVPGGVILTADNPHGWDGRAKLDIGPGDRVLLRAKLVGFYKGQRPA